MLHALFILSALATAYSSPFVGRSEVLKTAVNSATDFCMILPKNGHTNIGDSEHPGGMSNYCSREGLHNAPNAGSLPDNFWRNVEYKTGNGFVQLTGCINAASVEQLNVNDDGGQYDSSGGAGGHGNPRGSICVGYAHYVELVEPAGSRACIRCCNNPSDCPTTTDRSGCPKVIPGNYFDCA
ncbi:hypothetical protein MKEN_00408000 [Mycena kentingensis (nom. inval.)]|nr:hypothetical protein MKEN_00408000 [Mycena kentingensis (nom. inval.)]